MKKLILASNSPTRKKLLTDIGLVFEVIPSLYQEDMSLPLAPKELAVHLSREKARSVANMNPKAVVLGADTFVFYKNNILGKPHTQDRAREMLAMLSGKQHLVITGFTIIDVESNKSISKSVETKVFFKDLSVQIIDNYVATGEPLEKAGSYAILGGGSELIEKIEGSKTSVAGLPMDELMDALKEFGITVR